MTASRVTARAEGEERVTPLELFFDLIFVFAITQVTGLVSDRPTWEGLAQGMLLLGMLWWAWVGYSWLTNMVNPEEGGVRLAMFLRWARCSSRRWPFPRRSAAMPSSSLRRTRSCGSPSSSCSLSRAVGTGSCWPLSRVSRRPRSLDPGCCSSRRRSTGRLRVRSGRRRSLIDLAGPLVSRARGWHLSAGHFAERHALIVIIALGESIVALGLGATGTELDAGVIVAAALGLAIAAALWWAYFDVVAIVAERKLRETEGRAQLAMARDSYSYLHLPMIAGIILFAVGVKKTLAHVGDPLETVPTVALCGGVALYLVAHILFRLRNVRTLNWQRLVVSALLLAVIPVALDLPALGSLAVVAALCTALIAYEAIRFAEARDRVRRTARA